MYIVLSVKSIISWITLLYLSIIPLLYLLFFFSFFLTSLPLFLIYFYSHSSTSLSPPSFSLTHSCFYPSSRPFFLFISLSSINPLIFSCCAFFSYSVFFNNNTNHNHNNNKTHKKIVVFFFLKIFQDSAFYLFLIMQQTMWISILKFTHANFFFLA